MRDPGYEIRSEIVPAHIRRNTDQQVEQEHDDAKKQHARNSYVEYFSAASVSVNQICRLIGKPYIPTFFDVGDETEEEQETCAQKDDG